MPPEEEPLPVLQPELREPAPRQELIPEPEPEPIPEPRSQDAARPSNKVPSPQILIVAVIGILVPTIALIGIVLMVAPYHGSF